VWYTLILVTFNPIKQALVLLAAASPCSMLLGLAPVVTEHPESQLIDRYGQVVLSASVDISGPLTYQWAKDGVDLVDETNRALVITNAQTENAGRYTVEISNSDGSCIAGPASVFVGAERRWYVDLDAAGSNNGGCWEDAFVSLSDALVAAGDGDEIWVAEGVYKPSYSGDRNETFEVASFVRLLGGFAGHETHADERNWALNPTVLSGDLMDNDGGLGIHQADNSKRVVTVSAEDGATIDGFVITGGSNTVPAQQPDFGAGIGFLSGGYGVMASAAVVRNCVLRWNRAISYGGAIGLWGSAQTPLTIDGCTFIENQGTVNGGGAVQVNGCSLIVKNSFFADNHTNGNGGGAVTANEVHDILVANSVFDSNISGGPTGAAALRVYTLIPARYRVYQCTMRNNAAARGAVFFQPTSEAANCLMANSIVVGSGPSPVTFPVVTYVLSDQTIGGMGNVVGSPQFASEQSALGADGLFGTADDGLLLTATSPGVNAGLAELSPEGFNTDAAGNPRFAGEVDLGAYETPFPQTLLAENLLPNPFVERDEDSNGVPDFWNAGGSDSSGASWTLNSFVSTSHSLMVTDDSDTTYSSWISDRLSVQAGRSYNLRFFQRYSVESEVMSVRVRFWDAANNNVSLVVHTVEGEQLDWEQVELSFTVPSHAVELSIHVVSGGIAAAQGWIAIDDLSIARARPVITRGPESVSLEQGTTAIFEVEATGSGALSYQWLKDGLIIPGAINSSLSIANAQPWHIGDYSVQISDTNATIESVTAELSLIGFKTAAWKGLVGYYPFSGSPNDMTTFGNHLTVDGAVPTQDRNGEMSGAYSFVGPSDAVYRSSGTGPLASQAHSLSLWFRRDSLADGKLAGLGADAQSRFEVNIEGGILIVRHGNETGSLDFSRVKVSTFPTAAINVGEWHHVVVTTEGNEEVIRCYVDGQPVGEGVSGINNPVSSNYWIFVGSEVQSGFVRGFTGAIDNVRVYNRALSASDAEEVYWVENAARNWRQAHFGDPENTGSGADLLDFDFDGLSNRLEFALNLNPTLSTPLPASVLPCGNWMEFNYTRGAAALNSGVQFIVEWTEDFTMWHTSGVSQRLVWDNGEHQRVRAILPTGLIGRRFVRLRID
jgi:hypothetical protein